MTEQTPVVMISFNEARIKRQVIYRPLSKDEIKNGRRIVVSLMNDYDPEKHEFEVIRK